MCEKQKCNAEKMQFPQQNKNKKKKVSLPILKFYEIFGMQYFKKLSNYKKNYLCKSI